MHAASRYFSSDLILLLWFLWQVHFIVFLKGGNKGEQTDRHTKGKREKETLRTKSGRRSWEGRLPRSIFEENEEKKTFFLFFWEAATAVTHTQAGHKERYSKSFIFYERTKLSFLLYHLMFAQRNWILVLYKLRTYVHTCVLLGYPFLSLGGKSQQASHPVNGRRKKKGLLLLPEQ